MAVLRTEHFTEWSYSCGKDYNDREKRCKINQFLHLQRVILQASLCARIMRGDESTVCLPGQWKLAAHPSCGKPAVEGTTTSRCHCYQWKIPKWLQEERWLYDNNVREIKRKFVIHWFFICLFLFSALNISSFHHLLLLSRAKTKAVQKWLSWATSHTFADVLIPVSLPSWCKVVLVG